VDFDWHHHHHGLGVEQDRLLGVVAAPAADGIHDEEAARAWFEAARWPEGPFCPKCGSLEPYTNKAKPGTYRCRSKECRKDFTVMTKTVMERSHAPLTKWAAASDRIVVGKAMYEDMVTDARPNLPQIKARTTVLYAFDATMGLPQAMIDSLCAFAQ
jgi:hypothetical protein